MNFELLLPTSWPSELFWNLLRCVSQQTVMPSKVTVLRHKPITEQAYDTFLAKLRLSLKPIQNIILISNISFPDYQPGRGVGYDRNFLLQHATEDFCYMIDQDNEFSADHFELMIECYTLLPLSHESRPALLSPTIERRKSGKIQSRGILAMYYLFPKYIFNKNLAEEGYSEVQMIGGNSLFGPTKAMRAIWFDPEMQWCYEDIDFSYRWFQAGNSIAVSHAIRIHHMEKEQTMLSTRFLRRPEIAYARAYNRIRFVKKTASSLQKRAYLCCGVWIQTLWFLLLCLIYGGDQRWALIQAIWEGTRKWCIDV